MLKWVLLGFFYTAYVTFLLFGFIFGVVSWDFLVQSDSKDSFICELFKE